MKAGYVNMLEDSNHETLSDYRDVARVDQLPFDKTLFERYSRGWKC